MPKGITQFYHLYQRRMKQEALVRQFENDNEAYNKIRKTVEEKVIDALASRKELFKTCYVYIQIFFTRGIMLLPIS